MRTTSGAVIALLEEFNDDIDMDVCIEWANTVTTNVCVDDATKTPPIAYSTSLLEIIERYLSAHDYECKVRRAKFRAAGKVQESFESKVDLRLNQTVYGQQAIILDFYGNLAAFNNELGVIKKPLPAAGKRVGLFWAGLDDCP